MTKRGLLEISTSLRFLKPNSLNEILQEKKSIIMKRLPSCGVPRPLNPLQSVALLLNREYTERDLEFLRRFLEIYQLLKSLEKRGGLF